MSDTHELTRYVLLLTALIKGAIELEESDAPLVAELDALTIVLAHRSRSMVNYHETPRGKQALEHAAAIAPALEAGEKVAAFQTKRWSQEQAEGPIFPDMQPEETINHRVSLEGITLLGTYTQEADANDS